MRLHPTETNAMQRSRHARGLAFHADKISCSLQMLGISQKNACNDHATTRPLNARHPHFSSSPAQAACPVSHAVPLSSASASYAVPLSSQLLQSKSLHSHAFTSHAVPPSSSPLSSSQSFILDPNFFEEIHENLPWSLPRQLRTTSANKIDNTSSKRTRLALDNMCLLFRIENTCPQ